MIQVHYINDAIDMYMKSLFPIHDSLNVYTKTPKHIHILCHIDNN